MDKWKDLELNKMKVGGNHKAKLFLKSQPDFDENWSFYEKYNSKAAALLRDKVTQTKKKFIILLKNILNSLHYILS